jgi:siroheme synthase-like protein
MTAHPYYPLFFDIEDRLCVVIGGGNVAQRKVRALLAAHARVRVISPEATAGLLRLARSGGIELIGRQYRNGDLKGAVLAFAATDNSALHDRIRQDARSAGVPLNVADAPELCDFIVPSMVRKGPITIAIATSGLLPMLSKKLRKEIVGKLSSDFVSYARKLAAFRAFLHVHVKDAGQRRRIMTRVGKMDVSAVGRMTLAEMKKTFITGAPAASSAEKRNVR